jgi:hypothetical protein
MTTKSSANDTQFGGSHYQTEYQHWDFLAVACGYGEEYYIGCATKYITRYKKKNGLEDLYKARHFITKLAELMEAGLGRGFTAQVPYDKDIAAFCEANEQDEDQCFVLTVLFEALYPHHLREAIDRLNLMIDKLERKLLDHNKEQLP